jgi:hypothetical protein
MSKVVIPNVAPSYPAGGCQFTVDKTGTLFFLHVGRLVPDGPWGTRLYRVKPNSNAELIWFGDKDHADLSIFNNQLYVGFCTDNWKQDTFFVDSYIGWGDQPSGQIVNVDETALNALKASINAVNIMANAANAKAQRAQDDVNALYGTVKTLEAKVNQLQTQVNGLLTPTQVADLVWQKIKDINYLYRMAFNIWPAKSPDPDINAYVTDLVALIRKAK